MTKMQKVWLGIFMAMFVVPEALWSPVGNTIFSFFQSGKISPKIFRNNFLLEYRYEMLLKIIVVVQLIGILSTLIYAIKFRKNIKNLIFWPFLLGCFLLAIITLFTFYLLIIFSLSFP